MQSRSYYRLESLYNFETFDLTWRKGFMIGLELGR